MKLTYAVVYERTPNNYSAYAPDVPGCISTGDTWEEIRDNIREALTYHLEMLRDYGDPIPEPRLSPDKAMAYNSESLAADEESVSQPETVVGTVELEVELTPAAMASWR